MNFIMNFIEHLKDAYNFLLGRDLDALSWYDSLLHHPKPDSVFTRELLLSHDLQWAKAANSFWVYISIAQDSYRGSLNGKKALKEAWLLAKTYDDYRTGWSAAVMVYGWRSPESLKWSLKGQELKKAESEKVISLVA